MIGRKIAHYEVLGKLGQGGMGEVYRARDTRLDREVALKLLPGEVSGDRDRRARFEREAKAVAALNHPNIVTVHSIEEHEGSLFLTMELVEGETLARHVPATGLELEAFLQLALPLVDAVASAHARGITHRDLKPANVMVDAEGRVKVLDFGLVKLLQPSTNEESATLALEDHVTEDGKILGSAPYMSPEQAEGKAVDHRSDIFSLGILLYEMATGRRPFQGDTSMSTITSILRDTPLSPTTLKSGLPAGLDRIVQRCLAKDPQQRYQSAMDLRHDLQELATEHEGSSRSRRGKVLAGIAAALVVVVGLAYVLSRGLPLGGGSSSREVLPIAVLPFSVEGRNQDIEHIADGVTEALISQLSRLPSLRVKASSTVLRYKDSDREAVDIGKELGVSAVVTGWVRTRAEYIVVSAELVNVADGSQLWGDRYTRLWDELLVVEQKAALSIAEGLQLRLTGEEEQELTRQPTENAVAYDYYLKGRYYWKTRTAEGVRWATEMFTSATTVDSTFALAYAGLADALLIGREYGYLEDATDACERAKAAATKAIEIDDTLAEAYTTLGASRLGCDFNWTGAEQAYRRAIELDPHYATGLQWYGELLGSLNRLDEAIAMSERAVAAEPDAPIVHISLGWHLSLAARYDEADAQYERARELLADSLLPDAYRLGSLFMQGSLGDDPAQLMKIFERFWPRAGGRETDLAELRESVQRDDFEAVARWYATHLARIPREEYAFPNQYPFHVCAAQFVAGDVEAGFASANRLWAERNPALAYFFSYPPVLRYRDDERFRDLARKTGWPGLDQP